MSTGPHDPVAEAGPGAAELISDVTEMVRRSLLDYGEWTAAIAPNARLDADLGMQSVELAAVQGRMSQRWGEAANLAPLLRTLDLAGLTGLTVAAVAGWVAGRLPGGPGPGPASCDRADPDRADPDRADPDRADPGRADPGRADPGRADPGRADPGRADPDRADPDPTGSGAGAAGAGPAGRRGGGAP